MGDLFSDAAAKLSAAGRDVLGNEEQMDTHKVASEGASTPADAAGHLLAGAAHAEAGRLNEAENEFAAALLHAPQLHIARFQLGLLQWSSGRHAVALVTWQPLMALPAGVDLGHFARGFRLWAVSDLPGATAEFRQGVGCCGNAPLAQDMRKLLDTIPAPASTPTEHVLLKNYGANHLH
jgi:hypothetical protein